MANSDEKTSIRVGGVPEHFNLPWRLALEDDAFADVGVSLRYDDYPGGTGAMTAALGSDELDMALVLTEGAVLDILKGSDNRLIKVYVESPLTWGIHVAASGDIATIDAIENRPVAISRYGSGSHLIAIVDGLERGFDADRMRFVVVDSLAGVRDALRNGDADVFLWEKHMTQPLVDAGEFRRVGERIVPWPAFVVSAKRAFLETHGPLARQVLDIVGDYAANLAGSPAAAGLIGSRYGISEADARAWLSTVRWHNTYERPDAAIDRIADALRLGGVLDDEAVSLDAIWHPL